MNTVKELFERECGGANPLMRLASHSTKDQALKQVGSSRLNDHDQFIGEFLADGLPFESAPSTFSMDALLHEMKRIEHTPAGRVAGIVPDSNFSSPADLWANQFTRDIPSGPLAPDAVLGCEWTREFLHGNSQEDENLLAREYLERIDTEQQHGSQDVADSLKWMEQLEETDALADAAKDLVTAIKDPKLERSQFMQFMKQISDGEVKVKDNAVIVKNDVVMSSQPVDNWTQEFLSSNDVSGKQWADEFNESSHFDSRTAELNNQYSQSDLLAGAWVDEFSGAPAAIHSNDQEIQEDFWESLQSHWDKLAKEDESGLHWASEYDNFDADSYYKDYQFHVNNVLLDHEDPFGAGVEQLGVGNIPGAVLFFEAAVQKNPQHAKAWQYLGTTLADNEQEPEAIAALRKCIELEPTNLAALLSLAVSFTNESLMQRACQVLCDWLRHNPRYSHLVTSDDISHTSHRPYVSSFMSSEYHSAVKDFFMKAVLENTSEVDADVQIGLGILFNLSSEFDKAVDCFTTALQQRPNDSLLWNKLGATLANASRSEEAVDAYRQALHLSPGYIRTRYNLGVACVNLGVYREAMGHFLSALEIQQSSSKSIPVAGSRSVMSDNLWSAVDTTLSLIGRKDLRNDVIERNITGLLRAFANETEQNSHDDQNSSLSPAAAISSHH